MLLESLKNLRMSLSNELLKFRRTIDSYNACSNIVDNISYRFEKLMEDMDSLDDWIDWLGNDAEEVVELEFNNEVYLDIYAKDDASGWDMYYIVRYITKYYDEELGDTFHPHKKTMTEIINLFAYLSAYEFRRELLEYMNKKRSEMNNMEI